MSDVTKRRTLQSEGLTLKALASCCVTLSHTVEISFSVRTHACMQCCFLLLCAAHAHCASSGLEPGRTRFALTMQDVLLRLSTLHRDGWRRRVALLTVLLLVLQQGSGIMPDVLCSSTA